MSDQAPQSFGGTPGKGEWKDLQDFLKNPKDVAGDPGEAGVRRRQGVQELTRLTTVGERADGTAHRARRPPPRGAGAGPRKSVTGTRTWRRGAVPAARAGPARRARGLPDRVLRLPQSSSTSRARGFVGLRQLQGALHRRRASAPRSRTTRSGWWSRPTVATALGLIFAVLTERVRWGTAFKLVVFMPMAISMLAAGIIFRLVYEQDPGRRASPTRSWVGVHDTFAESSAYPEGPPAARPAPLKAGRRRLVHHQGAGARPGTPVALPLVGVAAGRSCPATRRPRRRAAARPAARSPAPPGWTSPGRRRQAQRIDPGEKALDGRQGRGGQGRQGGRLGEGRRRRHVHPARHGGRRPTAAARRRTSRSRTTASTGSARPWSPRRSSAATSGCGRASRWC